MLQVGIEDLVRDSLQAIFIKMREISFEYVAGLKLAKNLYCRLRISRT